MQNLEIEVEKRDIIGKKVKYLRREGKTPANIYGPKINSIPVQVDTKKLSNILNQAGETDLITLKIDGKKSTNKVMVREVQREILTGRLLHVDFYQVDLTHKIKVDVPLVFVGEAPVLKKKNVSIIHMIDAIHIEALPDHIPHNIEVDLSSLKDIDQAIFVKDIKLGADVTIHSDPEQIIAKAIEAKAVVEEVPVEAKAEAEEVVAEKAEGEAVAKEAKTTEE